MIVRTWDVDMCLLSFTCTLRCGVPGLDSDAVSIAGSNWPLALGLGLGLGLERN